MIFFMCVVLNLMTNVVKKGIFDGMFITNDGIVMAASLPERKTVGTIFYVLVPGGLELDVSGWASEVSERLGWAVVLVKGMDWNDDLTPWPAPGVFRKGKPFGGGASCFLDRLCNEYVPALEAQIPLEGVPVRILAGISLSGLFALWAAHRTGIFTGVASISGSLWYDGFEEWVMEHSLDPAVACVYLSLGDRERNSRDAMVRTVQDRTEAIVRRLRGGRAEIIYNLEEGVTHFSPVVSRLGLALDVFAQRHHCFAFGKKMIKFEYNR
jgi:Predicted hydrolase of the alpha/beta superfamily